MLSFSNDKIIIFTYWSTEMSFIRIFFFLISLNFLDVPILVAYISIYSINMSKKEYNAYVWFIVERI